MSESEHGKVGHWVKYLAQTGYTAKGIVYLIVGILSTKAAWDSTSAEGSQGAVRAIGNQPFGQFLLVAMGVGLLAYAGWRAVQVILDPEDKGTDGKGIVTRLVYAVSGLAYLSLAFLAFSAVFGWGRGGSGDGGSRRQELTAQLMALPLGKWLVMLVGLLVVAVGCYHFYQVASGKLMDEYDDSDLDGKTRDFVRRFGQVGLSARGVTFSIIGILLVVAGWQANPERTKGLSGALQTLAEQPFGPWLLAAVAIGLAAYGIYCFTKAKYRQFPRIAKPDAS